MIVLVGFDALAGARLGGEIQPVAEALQQPLLEDAQHRLERRPGAQSRQRLVIVIEELRVRIMTRREPDQQLVQVESGQETRRRERRALLRALRSEERRVGKEASS